MSYQGYKNWGTWQVSYLIDQGDYEGELREVMADCQHRIEADRELKAWVIEQAEQELSDGSNFRPWADTLLEEGAAHIDWVSLTNELLDGE